MKYIIIPYIALGLVLSLSIGIHYTFEGQEIFPDYYGSPFIFKQKSLGSSMEYFYSVTGLFFNVIIWTIPVTLFYVRIKKIKRQKLKKNILIISSVILCLFTTLNLIIDNVMLGSGFNPNLNYWYWNVDKDKEAKDYKVKSKSKIVFFKK